MNVVHVIPSLDRGGAEKTLLTISSSDSTLQHYIVLLGTSCSLLDDISLPRSSKPQVLTLLSPRFYLLFIAAFINPATRHLYLVSSWMYHSSLLSLFLCLIFSKPLIVNVRHDSLDSLKPLTKFIALGCSVLLKSSTKFFTIYCSKSSANKHVSAGFPSTNICVIHNGPKQPDPFYSFSQNATGRSKLGAGKNTLILANVGRYSHHKGHSFLLDAANLLHNASIPFHIILAGDGIDSSNQEFISFFQRCPIRSYFTLLGPVSNPSWIYQLADLYVLPSITESFPNALVEAMSYSLPAVCTDVGDVSLILGQSGWLIKPKSATALYGAIVAAYSDFLHHTVWDNHRHASCISASRFSQASMIAQHISFYTKLLQRQ